LQVSMLIYSITDLRTLAKNPKKKRKLKTPEKILDLPLSLPTCLEMLEENYDAVKEEFGDDEHANTMSSLQAIHARYQKHAAGTNNNNSSSNNSQSSLVGTTSYVGQWFKPFARDDQSIEVQSAIAPVLTAFGDESPDTDMVYAVGVDSVRKRVTVAFRGSVTPSDFMKDVMITMNLQPNPVRSLDSECSDEKIGIHHGFYEYLLKSRHGKNKLQEIVNHVTSLFVEVPERQKDYKVYVTGHSLGGALATLFSLYVAASIGDQTSKEVIPGPITCISVASPRVGDRSFQKAFNYLEQNGLLRHLRIANERDPVTMMPNATGKKIWATLSPVSYLAFKLKDNQFEEKESFHHTGVKLKLSKGAKYDFFYMGAPMGIGNGEGEEAQSDTTSSKGSRTAKSSKQTSKKSSIRRDKIPDVTFHLGKAYTENMSSVKTALSDLSLNDLYRTQVASIFEKKMTSEDED